MGSSRPSFSIFGQALALFIGLSVGPRPYVFSIGLFLARREFYLGIAWPHERTCVRKLSSCVFQSGPKLSPAWVLSRYSMVRRENMRSEPRLLRTCIRQVVISSWETSRWVCSHLIESSSSRAPATMLTMWSSRPTCISSHLVFGALTNDYFICKRGKRCYMSTYIQIETILKCLIHSTIDTHNQLEVQSYNGFIGSQRLTSRIDKQVFN
jgi:hypothetical protein